MKTKEKSARPVQKRPMTSEERGVAAAKAMTKALITERKRWNMPLITWKNGKVVSVKP